MILQAENISKYGVRVEQNISPYVIKGAIQNAELLIFRPLIGNFTYNRLVELAQKEPDNVLLVGGLYKNTDDGEPIEIAGANCAIANIAYGFLVHNKLVATAFGSVVKDSDLSHAEDAFKYANLNVTIGKTYTQQLADVLNIPEEERGKVEFDMWGIR